jgi:hypothetical protein
MPVDVVLLDMKGENYLIGEIFRREENMVLLNI